MNIFQKINFFCSKHHLLPQDSIIIVGLSGGPDSVFLLHFLQSICFQNNLTLIAAHLDHGWRSESGQDLLFCKKMSESFDIPFVSMHLQDLPEYKKYNGSAEEFARNKRRQFFELIRTQYNANYIALAHHANDQQETFFIRLLRGSSLTGIVGMQPKNGYYIRPLLCTLKKDIIDYLDTHTIPYLKDSTNTSDNFLRNRIRNHAIPALQKCDSRFDTNFERTLALLQETEQFIDSLSHKAFETISIVESGHRLLNIEKLCTLDPVLCNRVLILWLISYNVPFTPSSSFFEEMIRFLGQKGNRSHQLHPLWKVHTKNGFAFILFPQG